jgi:uncharacterized membrane protein YebE (DUF533 family)
MFDAKRLLEQFVGGGAGRQGPGYGSGHGGSPLEQIARSLGGGGGGSFGGPLGGSGGGLGALGLAGLLLGSKKGRKFAGSGMKLGGMALVASLAYKAYQDWQASQAGRAGGGPAAGGGFGSGGGFLASAPGAASLFGGAPSGTPFNPASEAEQQTVGRTLLLAMISAAKADGHIDADEQRRIFAEMDKLALDADDKAFLMDALRAPLDVDGLARLARGPEEAAEIYAASLLAIDADEPAERAYLALLAARLRLDDALVQHLHGTVGEATRGA